MYQFSYQVCTNSGSLIGPMREGFTYSNFQMFQQLLNLVFVSIETKYKEIFFGSFVHMYCMYVCPIKNKDVVHHKSNKHVIGVSQNHRWTGRFSTQIPCSALFILMFS